MTELSPLRHWLYRALPRPKVESRQNAVSPCRIVVLHKSENPTLDYYLTARLEALGLPWRLLDIERATMTDIEPDGTFVIICRYARLRDARWIRRHRARLAGVAYLIDDDIPAMITEPGTQLDYRLYLGWFALLPLAFLRFSRVWPSTPALRTALDCRSDLLPPAPVLDDHEPLEHPSGGPLKLVFHATNIHHREHRFLVPIVEDVMAARPAIRFEVIARGTNARLWRRAAIDPTRIDIVAPMEWPDYHRHSRECRADIALVPLVEGPSNKSRSASKRIDCRRLGAAPVFSDIAPYNYNAQDPTLIANDPRRWVETLIRLCDDAALRQTFRETNAAIVRAMLPGEPVFPGIVPPAERTSA